jgi:hypothetical protein
MKKLLSITLLSLLLCPGFIFAQDSSTPAEKPKPNFWFGPKIGLDLAQPTIDEATIKQTFKSNAQIGIFFQFGRKLYLQPEFYYAMHKESNYIAGKTTETNVNTLKIPVMVGLRLINLGIISAHIMAGPQASFFLNESNPIANSTRKSSNYNFQFGGGIDLLGFITLDVRYSSSLSAIKSTVSQLNWEKSAVNATLGLKFR